MHAFYLLSHHLFPSHSQLTYGMMNQIAGAQDDAEDAELNEFFKRIWQPRNENRLAIAPR